MSVAVDQLMGAAGAAAAAGPPYMSGSFGRCYALVGPDVALLCFGLVGACRKAWCRC